MFLFNKFKKKNDNSEQENKVSEAYNVKFPFYVDLYKVGYDEEKGDEPKNLKGKEAYEILTNDDIEGVCFDFESSELYKYLDKLGEKIVNIKMKFLEDGFIKLTIFTKSSLSDEEKQELLSFISGQMSDGWGEGNFYYEKETGEGYEIRFWKYNDWNIEFI